MGKKIKNKISNKNKVYWLNLFYYWLIFIIASILVAGSRDLADEPTGFNFTFGFTFVSICSAFVLGHVIARKFSRGEELDELRTKEGLSHQEFRSKYGKVFDIFHE